MPVTAEQAVAEAIANVRVKLDDPEIICQSEYTAVWQLIDSILESYRHDDDLLTYAAANPGLGDLIESLTSTLQSHIAGSFQELLDTVIHIGRVFDADLTLPTSDA